MLILGLCGNSDYSHAQVATTFDPFESHKLFDEVSSRLANNDVDSDYLTKARTDVLARQLLAESCESEATAERNRLEALYEPLKTIDGNVDQIVFTQYLDIKSRLDEAISRQAQCRDSRDSAAKLIARIADYQTSISQQFLSHRDYTILGALRALPHRLADIPDQLPESIGLELLPGITAILLFWVLVGGGTLAAVLGVFLRHRFYLVYQKAGGDDAPPQFWLLFLKPLADHGPLLLEGITLTSLLLATLNNASAEMAVIRLAVGISMYGLARVIIDWATGPMSPSISVKGLVPDHVKPFRRRLRILTMPRRALLLQTVSSTAPGFRLHARRQFRGTGHALAGHSDHGAGCPRSSDNVIPRRGVIALYLELPWSNSGPDWQVSPHSFNCSTCAHDRDRCTAGGLPQFRGIPDPWDHAVSPRALSALDTALVRADFV